MKFRIFVGICPVAIAYGVLYSNLPCWAQVFQQSFTCQLENVWIATPAERKESMADDIATARKMMEDLVEAEKRSRAKQ